MIFAGFASDHFLKTSIQANALGFKPISFWKNTNIDTYLLDYFAFYTDTMQFSRFFLNFHLLLTMIALLDKSFKVIFDVMLEKSFRFFFLNCIDNFQIAESHMNIVNYTLLPLKIKSASSNP